MSELSDFLTFQRNQGGVLPVSLAAEKLRVTPQAVHRAIKVGDLAYITACGRLYCGLKSVEDYRWTVARNWMGRIRYFKPYTPVKRPTRRIVENEDDNI